MSTPSDAKPAVLVKMTSLVQQAIADTVALNRKLGGPIYILRDGQIVDIAQEPLGKTESSEHDG